VNYKKMADGWWKLGQISTAKRLVFIDFLFMWTKVTQNIPNFDNYFFIKSINYKLIIEFHLSSSLLHSILYF
jgi:hypothetical protein